MSIGRDGRMQSFTIFIRDIRQTPGKRFIQSISTVGMRRPQGTYLG